MNSYAAPEKASTNKTQHVYDYVMTRILDGSFPGGSSLNIGTLADETGVSLIPTREALRRLESEGLIEFIFHRGVRVREVSAQEYRDIMQTETVLEALAVGLSAELLTYRDIAQARDINARMNDAQAAGDFPTYNALSFEFHNLLRRPCPNQHLTDLLERGRFRIAATRASLIGYSSKIAKRLSDEHEHLLDRIVAGAPASEIEQLMRAHREGTLADDSEIFQQTVEAKLATGSIPTQ